MQLYSVHSAHYCSVQKVAESDYISTVWSAGMLYTCGPAILHMTFV